MRLAVTAVAPAGHHADLLIDADPAVTVAELASQISQHLAGPPVPAGQATILQLPRRGGPARAAAGAQAVAAVALPAPRPAAALFIGQQELPPGMILSDTAILDGAVIGVTAPAEDPRPGPVTLAELRVTGGPAAGGVHHLAAGRYDIGGPPGPASQRPAHRPDITVPDPAVPPFALRIFIDARGCLITPFPGAEARLEEQLIAGSAPWQPGEQVTVGGSVLEVAAYEPPDAALHPAADGASLEFNRPPRLRPPAETRQFTLPSPPGQPERRPVPVLMAAAPAVLGVVLAVALRQVYMLAMAGFGPVMLLASHLSDRRHGRRTYLRRHAEYLHRKADVERDTAAAVAAEQQRRRNDHPDPAAIASIAAGPRRRLWERRRTDPDYLLLRAATADLPSAVELTEPAAADPGRGRAQTIRGVPVSIALPQHPVIGVAGPGGIPRAAARWLAAQVAVLHSPQDVQLCVLTDASGQDAWQWVRWLPHCRPAPGQNCAVLIGNDAETVATRLTELQAIIAARQPPGPGQQPQRPGRDIFVIFDGSRKLRSMPGAIQVLRDGPAAGVYSLCLDAEERLLPAECQAVIAAQPGGTLTITQMNAPPVTTARPEYVSPQWAGQVARPLAAVRDISDGDPGTVLPASCRLLTGLGMDPPAAAAISAAWRAGGQSTVALLGDSYDGPFGVDLRKDGPHALIAGTTGSGKSELLQAIIVSLAAVNRPDAMTFVLIDYKGGSAFAGCAGLPHVTGLVTDLDAHLTERALASLSAELTRREQILAAAGAQDLDRYLTITGRGRHRAGPAPDPLPRLVIVIDEFASLARDLPAFVTGLVSLAQRGRSLGMHLILATQRPAGVVSADIRANTNLRIALRVTDTADSIDVIGVPDAARIGSDTPGRGYIRLGHSSLLPFQAGRISGPAPGTASRQPPWVTGLEWAALGHPAARRPAPPGRPGGDQATDLAALAGQIRQAATGLGLAPQASPWLPPLPAAMMLGDLAAGTASRQPLTIPFGTDDLPAAQQRRVAALHLDTFGHLLAAGGPGSGRSQLLRTLAASAAARCSAADVHLYGVDGGNGALLPLAALPHCGAVSSRSQPERATRLLAWLREELQRRQELLAGGGYTTIAEQRAAAAPGTALPHILLLLDRWEGVSAPPGPASDAVTEAVTQILTEGASAGVHLVMTGDRSLLAGRIAALCEDKLTFRLPDPDDYTLIGLRARDLPDQIPPGRAFWAQTGTETQIALLAADSSGPGQAAALTALAEQVTARDAAVPPSRRPHQIQSLPATVTFGDAWGRRPPEAAGLPLWALAGVGGDNLTGCGVDLAAGTPAFTVAGPARSGRSAVLQTMARSLLAAGTPIIGITPRPSPLQALAGHPAVHAWFTHESLGEDEFAAALASLPGPAAVIADDAELLIGCEASGQLAAIIARRAPGQVALVYAGDADTLAGGFGGWHVDARHARRGCLTAPQTLADGDLVGAQLARAQTGHPPRPGRALLHTGDGTFITITVPELTAAAGEPDVAARGRLRKTAPGRVSRPGAGTGTGGPAAPAGRAESGGHPGDAGDRHRPEKHRAERGAAGDERGRRGGEQQHPSAHQGHGQPHHPCQAATPPDHERHHASRVARVTEVTSNISNRAT